MKAARISRIVSLAAICGVFTVSSLAANLCVRTDGANGCFTTISAAVTAAAVSDVIAIAPGTYHESVTITKPLSLVGSDGAIIDATGLLRGIFVDGLSAPGLNAVHISGLKVQNANLEGILVANSSNVTVASNTVLNNNKALVDGSCTMLPSIEPGSAQDCGEGIHVMGANHSIVTLNTIQGNAGGILISDDTGATYSNLISNNTVTDNPYACGITMASHVPAPISGSQVPLGVYRNTVVGNRSKHNGYGVGGGSGIGIFASVPGAGSYQNVVVGNYVAENGHPGISMHSHAPGQMLSDNMIVSNTVVNNGADTGDAATPGPTGINLYSLLANPGNIISGNSIQNESYDVGVSVNSLVQVQFNDLLGTQTGLYHRGAGTVDATENWWGCSNGPTLAGSCSSISGTGVLFNPWMTVPVPGLPSF